jgi:hypothetical protein
MRCVNADPHFGRVEFDGKVFRENLETDVFTTDRLRSGEFIRTKRKSACRRCSTNDFNREREIRGLKAANGGGHGLRL